MTSLWISGETNTNAKSNDTLPCRCCSLSPSRIQKSWSVAEKMIKMKNSKCEAKLNAIEERHEKLITQRQRLKEKLCVMEKTVPLLMASNIWRSGIGNGDLVVNRVKEFIHELLPNSRIDTVHKIIEDTKNRVGTLNIETTNLQEKIIEAEVKLEESEMMLESLRVINDELSSKLRAIKDCAAQEINETDSQLLDRGDSNCLSKLKQLIQREIHLKKGIKALRDHENRIHTYLDHILSTSKQLTKDIGMVHGTKNHKANEFCECCKCDDAIAEST